MPNENYESLLEQVDQLLDQLKIGDAADRMQEDPRDPGTLLLDKGMLEEAVDSYRYQSEHPHGGQFAIYHSLYNFLAKEVEQLTQDAGVATSTNDPKPILLSIPVWGAEYIRGMMAVLLPTLLAPGNIESVATNRKVIFEFSVKSSDAPLIENAGCVQALDQMHNVSTEIARFPDEVFSTEPPIHGFAYRIMGAMHHRSIFRARAMGGAYVVFLGSDFILSDGLLASAIAHADDGFELVLTAPMKVSKNSIIPAMLDDNNESSDAHFVSLSPRRLVDLGIRYMHPESRQLIVSTHTKPFSKAPFPLYFPETDGYSVRSFMYHPLVLGASAVSVDRMYDYNTVDGMFIDRVLQGRAPQEVIKLIDHSDEGVFFDVCADRTVKETEVVDEFSLPGVIEWLYRWRKTGVEDVYKWLLLQNVKFRPDCESVYTHADDFDEEMVTRVLVRTLERLESV